ncbi:MAG: hypothetical protein Q8942_11170, partial [Bacillota bacterium]|nr:hypothetical protein [Bacillota bacterium]
MKKSIKKVIACFMALILLFGQLSYMFAYDLPSYTDKEDSGKIINYQNPDQLKSILPESAPSAHAGGTQAEQTAKILSTPSREDLQNSLTQFNSVSGDVYSSPGFETTPTSAYNQTPEPTITNLQTGMGENTLESTPVPTYSPTPVITPTDVIQTATQSSTSTPTSTYTSTSIPSTELPAVNINSDIILNEDTVYGNLNLSAGTLNLNGYNLTVQGNLTQSGGTMDINGGKLEVIGDYSIKSPSTNCYAYLKMVNEADYVTVEGNFTMQSYYNHSGYLTAGTMEVKGNFNQIKDKNSYIGYENNFAASGTHKVILSGKTIQNVSFENPGSSTFN